MQRRNFIKTAAISVFTLTMSPAVLVAETAKVISTHMTFKVALDTLTHSKEAKLSDLIKLSVPEIAENGAVVPVKVEVDSPMSEENHVTSISIFTTGNGNSRGANTTLSPLNGKAFFSTRVKLGSSQEVAAVAALSDGTFIMAKAYVKVTIGGCG